MSSNLLLRSVVATATSKTRIYYPGQWALGRLAGGFILAYHDLPPSVFEEQVQALFPNQPVHLSELICRLAQGRSTSGLFAITFDDGVASTVEAISTVCIRRHWPVTFFLPTRYLDDQCGMAFQRWQKLIPVLPHDVLTLGARPVDLRKPARHATFLRGMQRAIHSQAPSAYEPLIEELVRLVLDRALATDADLRPPSPVSWSRVATLAKTAEVRFESHGLTHTAVASLADGELEDELTSSKHRLFEHTGKESRHFCYPFGGLDSIGIRAPSIVARHFDSGLTMARGRLGRHDPFLLPRIPVYERDDAATARLKILTL